MTAIWVPRTKITELEIQPPPVGLEGWYTVDAIGPDGRRRPLVERRRNTLSTLVVADFWPVYSVLTYGYIGRSTLPPSTDQYRLYDEDYALVRKQLLVPTGSGIATTPVRYGWRSWTATFAAPAEVYPAAELGFGMNYAGGGDWPHRVWMRELFRERDGTPYVYQWQPGTSLVLTYEARLYPFLDDVTTSGMTLRASEVDSTSYWCFWGGPITIGFGTSGGAIAVKVYSGDMGAITGLPTGSAALATLTAVPSAEWPSGPAGWNMLYAKASWAPSSANWPGGVRSLLVPTGVGCYQVQFEPALPKTDVDTLTIYVSSPLFAAVAP